MDWSAAWFHLQTLFSALAPVSLLAAGLAAAGVPLALQSCLRAHQTRRALKLTQERGRIYHWRLPGPDKLHAGATLLEATLLQVLRELDATPAAPLQLPDLTRVALRSAFGAAVAHGQDFDLELEWSRDGTGPRWVRVRGGVAGAITTGRRRRLLEGTVQDISAVKEQEAVLRRQAALRELLLEIATPMINLPLEQVEAGINRALADMGRFVGADRAYIFRYDFAAGTCSNTHEWCAPGISPQIRNLQDQPLSVIPDWVAANRRGEPMIIPNVAVMANAGLQEVLAPQGIKSLLAVPLMLGAECLGFVGFDSVRHHHDYSLDERRLLDFFAQVLVNVQERRRQEAALRESERRFRMLLDDVPSVSIQGYRPDGTIQYWNQGSVEIYGYTAEEAIGRNLLDLIIPPEAHAEATTTIAAMVRSGRPAPPSEMELLHKSGRRVPVYSCHCLVRGLEQPPELFCIDVDLSEIKSAQAERERLQAQLAQSQKLDSIGQLAGGVAHDFNNALHAILGRADLALMDLPRDDPNRTHLEEIRRASLRSAALTRQLLAFGRRQTVSPRPLPLDTTLSAMRGMLAQLISEDIQLTWYMGAPGAHVYMDPAQLDQVLVNLVINARDAIEGVGAITIETGVTFYSNLAPLDEANATDPQRMPRDMGAATRGPGVFLRVSDDGCGMDETTQAQMFEPFFTTKPVGRGTGLGLATVYGIVQQNGGAIQVDSRPGTGTRITIHLPVSTELAGPPDTGAVGGNPYTTGTAPGTILFIEDEAMILDLGRTLLENLGHRVLCAHHPAIALDLAQTHGASVDPIITDVVMPDMNGPELASRLRGLCPRAPVLFTSGHPAEVVARRGLLPGEVPFLHKPFSLEALEREVRALLGGAGDASR